MPAGYKPGDTVCISGIYRIEHGSLHRLMHVASIQAGIRFPCCRICGIQVRFHLMRLLEDPVNIPFVATDILQDYSEVVK
jgi:hypothetical protein